MLLSVAAVSPTWANAVDTYADARSAFKEAYARVFANVPEPAVDDSASLRNYPLYPYLEAARIQQALAGKPETLEPVDKKAAEFVAAYSQSPVVRNLQRTWLDSLAQRSQWGLFLTAYRDDLASDALRCKSFIARIELGNTVGLDADIAKQWLVPRSLLECERPFAWLKEKGGLTPDLIERRVRLTLEAGDAAFARQLIPQLPPERAGLLLQWASLLEKPKQGLDALIASPQTTVDDAVLLAGWTRLARTDRAAAKERYEALVRARSLDRDKASRYALALALPLAWDRDAVTLDYFARVAKTDFDDPAWEWRARAALWAKDWSEVLRSIEAMTPATRQTARWRYWEARAAEQKRDSKRARPLYESLLKDDNYYSALSAARLKRTIAPTPQATTVDPELLGTISVLPAFVRARELFLCGMKQEANIEWLVGFDSLNVNARLQAIRLAVDWGWYDQAVSTATTQRVFNDYLLLYPRPYDKEVDAAARFTQLQPDLVYGVVRQESLYRPDALSSAGARGLMQLLPDTARRAARLWKRPVPELADLFDPAINTSLGAAELRTLLDRFNGQTVVALAGYNAGPNAATRWLPLERVDADIWVENIPYNETRGYVQRILWHSVVFAWLRTGGEAQSTAAWLGPVKSLTEATASTSP